MRRYQVLSIAALLIAGCATRTVYITPTIDLPDPPILPTISAGELDCLSDPAYESLAIRDALRKGYADQLRAIIDEHNRGAE